MPRARTTQTAVAEAGEPTSAQLTRLERSLFNPDRMANLARALPPNLSPERFARITYQAIAKNPDLRACTAESLIVAIGEAAELGIAPTGALNRAFLLPFTNKDTHQKEAKLVLGYEGLSDLAIDSGTVRNISTRIVYEGDEFEVIEGAHPDLVHRPAFQTEAVDKIRFFYSRALLPTGELVWEVMTKAQVDKVRSQSKQPNGPAWVQNYPQMGRKTVLRRHVHSLKLTPAFAALLERDDERELGGEPLPTVRVSRTQEVRAALAERVTRDEPTAAADSAATGTVDAVAVDTTEPPSEAPGPSEGVIEPAEAIPPVPKTSASVAAVIPERELCGAVSPYGDGVTCTFVPHRAGVLHRNGDESWR